MACDLDMIRDLDVIRDRSDGRFDSRDKPILSRHKQVAVSAATTCIGSRRAGTSPSKAIYSIFVVQQRCCVRAKLGLAGPDQAVPLGTGVSALLGVEVEPEVLGVGEKSL